MRKLINGKNAARFPLWRERGTASLWLVVESRIHYVGIQESMLLFWDYCNQAIFILTLIKL